MTLQRSALDDKIWAEQQTGIGSTDAAAILNQSPWSSPFQVWERLTGQAEPQQDVKLHWRLGQELEGFIAQLYAHETGRWVRRVWKQHRHPVHEWMVAHLDFMVLGEPRLLEIKTALRRTDKWGAEGSAEIPVHYWIQVQHEMAVTGREIVDVPVLFIGALAFAIYSVERNPEFINKLILAESDFMETYVKPRVAPPVDGSEAARRFLNRQYPRADEVILPATPEQAELIDQLRLAEVNRAQAETAYQELRNRIIDIIGNNAGLRGPGFEITYRWTKEGKPGVNWEGVASTLRKLIEQLADAEAHNEAAVVSELGLPPGTPVSDALYTLEGIYQTPGKKPYRFWNMQDKEE